MNWYNTVKLARLKPFSLKAPLKKTRDNFVYLDIPNSIVRPFISMIDEKITKAPDFDKDIGAHISVIMSDEYDRKQIGEITELGQEFEFNLKDLVMTNPEGWDEMQKVWFVRVDSQELEKLRETYDLPSLNKGRDFHITIGVQKK